MGTRAFRDSYEFLRPFCNSSQMSEADGYDHLALPLSLRQIWQHEPRTDRPIEHIRYQVHRRANRIAGHHLRHRALPRPWRAGQDNHFTSHAQQR